MTRSGERNDGFAACRIRERQGQAQEANAAPVAQLRQRAREQLLAWDGPQWEAGGGQTDIVIITRPPTRPFARGLDRRPTGVTQNSKCSNVLQSRGREGVSPTRRRLLLHKSVVETPRSPGNDPKGHIEPRGTGAGNGQRLGLWRSPTGGCGRPRAPGSSRLVRPSEMATGRRPSR